MMFVGDIIPIFFVESKKIKSYRIDGAKMPFSCFWFSIWEKFNDIIWGTVEKAA